ncbi:hypothetical protein VNO78_22586 [Psophocarpus tetragonolobus]|uniref:Uncharacterized protein n=1 Tax=Psophocarpus tetragonolobus TaxID=3891 RepID=A0AAN9XBS7_PSOTE
MKVASLKISCLRTQIEVYLELVLLRATVSVLNLFCVCLRLQSNYVFLKHSRYEIDLIYMLTILLVLISHYHHLPISKQLSYLCCG